MRYIEEKYIIDNNTFKVIGVLSKENFYISYEEMYFIFKDFKLPSYYEDSGKIPTIFYDNEKGIDKNIFIYKLTSKFEELENYYRDLFKDGEIDGGELEVFISNLDEDLTNFLNNLDTYYS